MTSISATPKQAPPTAPELATALIAALAHIRQIAVAELSEQLATGDIEMESPEAIAAIAIVESQFGRRLARVEDLEPEQLTSVASLADLLHRRWRTGTPLPPGSEA